MSTRLCMQTYASIRAMWTEDALKHYKSVSALARALGISRQSIQKWHEVVPIERAFTLQDLTKGKLKVKPELYRSRNGT
jgi:transcriptional repressor of cell division inhibition gene dicB